MRDELISSIALRVVLFAQIIVIAFVGALLRPDVRIPRFLLFAAAEEVAMVLLAIFPVLGLTALIFGSKNQSKFLRVAVVEAAFAVAWCLAALPAIQ